MTKFRIALRANSNSLPNSQTLQFVDGIGHLGFLLEDLVPAKYVEYITIVLPERERKY